MSEWEGEFVAACSLLQKAVCLRARALAFRPPRPARGAGHYKFFLLMPSVTAFAPCRLMQAKAAPCGSNAFKKEEATRSGTPYHGSVSRRLGI
jgi:hypothetical protein